jgi:hypothetical protein
MLGKLARNGNRLSCNGNFVCRKWDAYSPVIKVLSCDDYGIEYQFGFMNCIKE